MPIEFKDYYKTLGVPRTATEDEIRKSFRKLARQYHPDVAKDKRTAEEKFKEINEAYEVLSDAEKRKKYDTLGPDFNRRGGFDPGAAGAFRGRSGAGSPDGDFEFRFGGTGFSEFFEQFFGRSSDRFRSGGGRSHSGGAFDEANFQNLPGGDIEADIMVTLDEAFRGSVRSISLERLDPRSGAAEPETFRVRIPAGVHEGQLIRIAGKGEPSPGGGRAGDLYLRVKFAKHPDLQARGADLIYELEVAPWEAVLGATVEVPTPEGSVSLKIPAGTVGAQRLRVRGRGLTKSEGGRGDLFVMVSVQVPPKVTSEEKKLWEALAKGSAFHPRKTTAD